MGYTHTIIGHTTGPAELRFLGSGAAVANFTVAETERTKDRDTNEWKDGVTTFWRVAVWRDKAEKTAEALTDTGVKVTVIGKVSNRPYEKDGQQRTSLEMNADEVSIALSGRQTVTVVKERGDSNGGGAQRASKPSNGGSWGGGHQQESNGGWGGQQGGNGGGWG